MFQYNKVRGFVGLQEVGNTLIAIITIMIVWLMGPCCQIHKALPFRSFHQKGQGICRLMIQSILLSKFSLQGLFHRPRMSCDSIVSLRARRTDGTDCSVSSAGQAIAASTSSNSYRRKGDYQTVGHEEIRDEDRLN
jgi:hypothetical protein